MIILGIDPGTAEMGWGIVEGYQPKSSRPRSEKKLVVRHLDHGLIKTPATDTKGVRLCFLKQEVIRLIGEYGVEEIAAEKIFFNINKKTAISVSQALGTVHLAAAELGIPVFEYNSLEAKRLLTANGRADKKVVQLEMKKRLRLKKHPTPVHAADALAIAFCHIIKRDQNSKG